LAGDTGGVIETLVARMTLHASTAGKKSGVTAK
jgi:hypothetical protein